jgi:hypothetical protein
MEGVVMNIHSRISKTKKRYIKVLSLLVVVSALIQIVFGQSLYASRINAYEVSSLSNQQRASAGLSALAMNGQLSNAAYQKANHMIANNYWGHYAPDGTSPWYFISANGYDYSTAGENLAKDFSTSAGVVTGWMNSPGHRANIMNGAFSEVGYAVVNGTLLGNSTTLVVALYAKPVIVAQPVTPAPTPIPAPTAAPATSIQPVAYVSTKTGQVLTETSVASNASKTLTAKRTADNNLIVKIVPCRENEVKNASLLERFSNYFKSNFKNLTVIINFNNQTA